MWQHHNCARIHWHILGLRLHSISQDLAELFDLVRCVIYHLYSNSYPYFHGDLSTTWAIVWMSSRIMYQPWRVSLQWCHMRAMVTRITDKSTVVPTLVTGGFSWQRTSNAKGVTMSCRGYINHLRALALTIWLKNTEKPFIWLTLWPTSKFWYKSRISNIQTCWSLRCSWCIVYWHCSSYIFILHLTPGVNGFGKDNCKTRRETFKFFGFRCALYERVDGAFNNVMPYIYIIYVPPAMWRLFIFECVPSKF